MTYYASECVIQKLKNPMFAEDTKLGPRKNSFAGSSTPTRRETADLDGSMMRYSVPENSTKGRCCLGCVSRSKALVFSGEVSRAAANSNEVDVFGQSKCLQYIVRIESRTKVHRLNPNGLSKI